MKIFKSTQKLLYIYTQLVVNRNRPEDFIILSPFDNNVTTWYAKRIPFMKLSANNVTIGRFGDNDGKLFGDFMSEITQEFLIEFPELADSSFSFFVKQNTLPLKRYTVFKKTVTRNAVRKKNEHMCRNRLE